jgi:hypothetical protein
MILVLARVGSQRLRCYTMGRLSARVSDGVGSYLPLNGAEYLRP